jgi:hypothetical protein
MITGVMPRDPRIRHQHRHARAVTMMELARLRI